MKFPSMILQDPAILLAVMYVQRHFYALSYFYAQFRLVHCVRAFMFA